MSVVVAMVQSGPWESDPVARGGGLAELMSWTSVAPDLPVEAVRDVLDRTVEAIVSAFGEVIGSWPDASMDP